MASYSTVTLFAIRPERQRRIVTVQVTSRTAAVDHIAEEPFRESARGWIDLARRVWRRLRQ